MATLQQLRSRFYNFINQIEANSDFTTSEVNQLIYEGTVFLSVLIKWPRDIMSIPVSQGFDVYTLPQDNLLLLDAFYGNVNITGDVKPLKLLPITGLKEKVPSWLDNTTQAQGEPVYLSLLDKQSVIIKPTPNADAVTNSRKLIIQYIYYPAALTIDSDIPDLPVVYHDQLPYYAAHLAYAGKLNNSAKSQELLTLVLNKVKELESPVTKEFDIRGFEFGSYDDPNEGGSMGIDPS